MDRRSVLRGGLWSAGGLLAASVTACAPAPWNPADSGPFDCGVASGVHSDTAVVLWTRFAPGAAASTNVRWSVTTDDEFSQVVASGTAIASPDHDGCVKVLAEGLQPGRRYWYRFDVDGELSPPGRTRTLPAATDEPASVSFAVASCQQFAAGYWPAWRAIANADVDAVIHLGDYIYESTSRLGARADDGRVANDLASYRGKYKLYRSDPDLRAAHQMHPFAIVWDDHEFVNNCNRMTILEQPERAAAAYQAWFEYQPVWPVADGSNRIHRRHRWGDLVDLTLLDTRQYRDAPIPGAGIGSTLDEPLRQVHSPDRTLLGRPQRDWLLDGFDQAQDDGVRWKLVANQVMITPLRLIDLDTPVMRALRPDVISGAGVYANLDDWSGFLGERQVVLSHLADRGIDGVGFLTGDVHMFFQSEVAADMDDAASPIVAQEFVCGSISSTAADLLGPYVGDLEALLEGLSPGFRHADLLRRGFGRVTCTRDRTDVRFHTVDALTPTPPVADPTHPGYIGFDWSPTHQVAMSRVTV